MLLELAQPHDHLAAHAPGEARGETSLDVLEQDRVVGHDLALEAVPAGDRVDQSTAFVLELHADAVQLLLDEEHGSGLLGPEVETILGDLVQGAHRDLVLLRRQARRRSSADIAEHRALRREPTQLAFQCVELVVRDLRCRDVVELSVPTDLLLELPHAIAG